LQIAECLPGGEGPFMVNSLFKIVYFSEMVRITAVRSVGRIKFRRVDVQEDRSSTVDTIPLPRF